MVYIVMAYIVLTCIVMAYIAMACPVMAYTVMSYTVISYTVVAYVVMFYTVMGRIVMAPIPGLTFPSPSCRKLPLQLTSLGHAAIRTSTFFSLSKISEHADGARRRPASIRRYLKTRL